MLLLQKIRNLKIFSGDRGGFLENRSKGFPKDFKHIDYLKCKEYICSYNVSDSFFTQSDVLEQIDKAFRQFKRFADFINYTIDDFE